MLKIEFTKETSIKNFRDILSVRAYNVITRAGFTDVRELASVDFEVIKNLRHAGIRTITEICKLVDNVLNEDRFLIDLKQYKEGIYIKERLDDALVDIKEVNSIKNNRKVTLLINLANNEAVTIGEKRNSLLMASKILGMEYLNIESIEI